MGINIKKEVNMKKRILIIGLLALGIVTSSLSAKEFDLKANMTKLNADLNSLQRGMMTSNKKAVEVALKRFTKDADELFNNRDQMLEMLPNKMKNKKHKANIAFDSSRVMKNGAATIRQAIADKGKYSVRKRQAKAQKAYLSMVNACFKCHNLVRDKGRIIEN